MKQLYFFILFFLSLLSFPSLAQDPAHFIIGEKQFANIDIYTLLYDDNIDVLYAGTNSGVYSYRQNKFIDLKSPKGQIGNSFFQLKQNSKGEVFCSNLNGQIFKIEDMELKLIYQVPADELGITFRFFFVENDEIVIVLSNQVRKIDAAGKEELLFDQLNAGIYSDIIDHGFFEVQQLSNGDIIIPFPNGYCIKYSQGKFSRLQHSKYPSLDKPFLSTIGNTFFNLNQRGQLRHTSAPLVADIESKETKAFFKINAEELLSLDTKKGVQVLAIQNDTLRETQAFFKNDFISTATANKKGTLFLGSFEAGIKVIPNKKIVLPQYEHLFSGIAVSPKNEVFLSTRGGEIFLSQKGLKLLDKRVFPVDHVFYTQDDFKISDVSTPNLLYESLVHKLVAIKDFHQLDRNNFLVNTMKKSSLISKEQKENLSNFQVNQFNHLYDYELFPSQRYTSITWSPSDSIFYCANNFGLLRRAWSSLKIDTLLWQGNSLLVNDLEYEYDQLICATEEAGILFWKNQEWATQISVANGLKSNSVKKILIQDGLMYILTKAGMQIYDLQKKEFVYVGVAEGLINDGVTNFALSKDKIWLLEKHSFYSIDIAQPQKENLIADLYIDSILVNEKALDYSSNLSKGQTENTFTYKENEFNIFFDYRNIESKAETTIEYTLVGFYKDWKTISTTSNNIEFQSLPIGNYTFKIKATYRNQSTKPFIYSFKIVPPFWQRWWFYLLLTLLGILISTFVFRAILERQRKELAIKNELNNSKLTAIRSQMNPHFIFNALNSIQHLVLKGNVDKSYSFINKFASLVRKTLEFSEEEFITLEEEIKLIEVYLTLEKLRFKDHFEFEIIQPERLDIFIPPMLVQPFIENAILHGLLHKKGQKKLTVKFQLNEKLTCIIEDNGVGRAKARAIKARQSGAHKSFSLNAIKQRFEILSDYYEGDLGYEYEDFEPSETQKVTTRVLLKIPIQNARKK